MLIISGGRGSSKSDKAPEIPMHFSRRSNDGHEQLGQRGDGRGEGGKEVRGEEKRGGRGHRELVIVQGCSPS